MFAGVSIRKYLNLAVDKIKNGLFVWTNLFELGLFILLAFASYFISRLLYQYIEEILEKIKALKKRKQLRIIDKLLFPLILMILIAVYYVIAVTFKLPFRVIRIFGNLVSAWFVVKVITLFFPRTKMFRFLSALIWAVAALRILSIYDQTINLLSSLSFSSGNLEISLLLLIKAIIIFSILFWLAGKMSRLVTSRIDTSDGLTPSVKVLLNKIAKFLIFTSAILFTLSAVGIDLTAFAFIGSAIGVGLGFGLQKIVSNFISGIIILVDKSIKPGDVVEIAGVYGWVKKLDTRFVSVVTRSGKEYLIPNEDFITKEVINWSYSDELVRVDAEVGVSYDSDLRQVEKLLLQSVEKKERIIKDPAPNALLMSFGDNEVVFEIRFWISDPRNGIQNIRSEVLLSIWDNFKENKIEIPFPQRDHYIKSLPDNLNEYLAQKKNLKNKTADLKEERDDNKNKVQKN